MTHVQGKIKKKGKKVLYPTGHKTFFPLLTIKTYSWVSWNILLCDLANVQHCLKMYLSFGYLCVNVIKFFYVLCCTFHVTFLNIT